MLTSRRSVLCAILIHYAFVITVNGSKEAKLIAEIPQGQLKGSFMLSSEQKQFVAFRGIPYAEPPLGKLRFNDPIPAKPWHGILDATKEAPTCLQYEDMMRNFLGREDCLYLNVYTRETSGDKLRPVLVWIHGGAWMLGSGNGQTYMYGPEYLMDEDIVVVTLNYRLAMFGFLSTEDAEVPGNYGLLDQVLALEWVKNNIESFGGDSKRITIFGESAGGASVHFMMVTPRTEGLFTGAVSQSGTVACPWATIPNPREKAFELGKVLGCESDNSKVLLECLRSVDSIEMIHRHDIFKKFVGLFPIPFGPRVDRERQEPVIPDEPTSLLKQGRYHAVPWITGVTKNEGALFVASLKVQSGLEKLVSEPEIYLPYFLDYHHLTPNPALFTNKVLAHYFDSKIIYKENLSQLVDATSDSLFHKGFIEALELHAEKKLHPIYIYQFSHRFKMSLTDIVGYTGPNLGVSHGDDLLALFRVPMTPFLGGDDKKVSKMTIKHLVNFATNGDPNGNVAPEDRVWLPVNEKRGYMDISLEPKFITEKFAFEDRLEFWNSLSSTKDEL